MRKYYDYAVLCSFDVRNTSQGIQVEHAGGGESDSLTTDGAVARLTAALQECLEQHFQVWNDVEHSWDARWTVELQHAFSEDEVHQAEEGGEGDLDPTDEALSALALQLRERLAPEFDVANVETWADFDCLLGTGESD